MKTRFYALLATAGLTLSAAAVPILQDEQDGHADLTQLGNAFGFNPAQNEPIPPGQGQYRWGGGGTQFTWTPGLTGSYEASSSWSTGGNNHTTSHSYFFDPDGAGPQPEVALAANVNQLLLADQVTSGTTVGNLAWSGFFSLGTFNLNPDSVFRVTENAGGPLSTSVWQFDGAAAGPPVPEGGNVFGVFAAACGSMMFFRRRFARRAIN